MKPTMRRYQNEDDYWRIRDFLRQTMLFNGRRELSWHVARLDYWRWHVVENCQGCDPVERMTFLWEAPDGHIAAVLNPEGRGEAHFQVHPGLRTPELEEAMLDVAEQRLAERRPDGRSSLLIFADHGNAMRRDLLTHAATRWLAGRMPRSTSAVSGCPRRSRPCQPPRATRCGRWAMRPSSRPGAGPRGGRSTPMSRMRSTRGGRGITTSRSNRFTGATWISLPCRISPRSRSSRPPAKSPCSVPPGMTT